MNRCMTKCASQYNLQMSEEEIKTRHRDGTTITILAELNDCPRSLIKMIVGMREEVRNHDNSRKNLPMILHDWNAGLPSKKIAMVYGFKTMNALYDYVFERRLEGHKFVDRCKHEQGAIAVVCDDFHKKLLAFRKKHGLTQRQLAEKMCKSQQTVRHLEGGLVKIKVGHIDRLATAYGMGYEQFIEECSKI